MIALVAVAGCGGSAKQSVAPPRVAAPDAGTRAGHDREPVRVTVPPIDRTAPVAVLRLGRAQALSGGPAPSPVRLAAPVLRPAAVGRDKQGMARIRVSLQARLRCGGETVPLIRYFPPPAVARARVAPGTVVPTQLTRRVRFRLRCASGELDAVEGVLRADATSAWETEASSAPMRFAYGP